MPGEEKDVPTSDQIRQRALARWENEGGAPSDGQTSAFSDHALTEVPALTNAELSQLHIRVIALEGLVTALLAEATDRQLEVVRDMAAYISPRPGFTPHPLTIRAATQMTDLLERASCFRAGSLVVKPDS